MVKNSKIKPFYLSTSKVRTRLYLRKFKEMVTIVTIFIFIKQEMRTKYSKNVYFA